MTQFCTFFHVVILFNLFNTFWYTSECFTAFTLLIILVHYRKVNLIFKITINIWWLVDILILRSSSNWISWTLVLHLEAWNLQHLIFERSVFFWKYFSSLWKFSLRSFLWKFFLSSSFSFLDVYLFHGFLKFYIQIDRKILLVHDE